MKTNRGRAESHSRRGQATFTGVVHQDLVLDGRPAIVIFDGFFEPGARSYWHSHEGGQVLLVKAGQGHIHTRSGESSPLRPGDVVYADPAEEHWHGANPDTFVIHTAISIGATTWLEAVSDTEYQRSAG
jgi:quercetin dioxygenase-like cupin family protein